LIRESAADRGVTIFDGDLISGTDAKTLLGVDFHDERLAGRPVPPYTATGLAGVFPAYRVDALARWLAAAEVLRRG
jgi:hypothetical protein